MYIYMCMLGVSLNFVCFYDFRIRFWNCSYEVVFSDFHFINMLHIMYNCDYGTIICASFLLSPYPFFSKELKGEMIIEDIAGKPVTAMKVFGTSIRALMNHLFRTFTERGIEIEPEDIRWVLTVPAIWADAAKQFMRKSVNLVNTI